MSLTTGDRVQESVGGGTTSVSLNGAMASYQSFASKCANGATPYVCFTDGSTFFSVEQCIFNVGTPNTLSRAASAVKDSSNGAGVLMTIPASGAYAFITAPAEALLQQAPDGGISFPSVALTPSTPASGATFFASNIAGMSMLAM